MKVKHIANDGGNLEYTLINGDPLTVPPGVTLELGEETAVWLINMYPNAFLAESVAKEDENGD